MKIYVIVDLNIRPVSFV